MSCFNGSKLRHAKMRLSEYVPAVLKVLEQHKDKYFVPFEDELGQKRADYIIATAIDGCHQGKQIGAGAKGGGKDVTLVNCQHLNFVTAANSSSLTHTVGAFNCKETNLIVRRMMSEMSADKLEMKQLPSPVIQLMKCDFKFHGIPLNGSLPANARCGSAYIRQRTALIKLTSKVIIELDQDPENFETIRQTADGETFVCAHFMCLDVRRALRAKNKQYYLKLKKEQPSLSEKQLQDKLYDFAVANGNGLCSDVAEVCAFKLTHPDEPTPSGNLFGVSDLSEFPTIDCMHRSD